MIPTNHDIDVIKAGDDLDIWGNPIGNEPKHLKGNLRSQTGIVRDGNGEERVYQYSVLFVGYIDITTDDSIRFVEPNGEVVETLPLKVKFMRGLDGQVGFTKAVL